MSRDYSNYSLDSGGVRSLSSILNRERTAPTQPWQEFNLTTRSSRRLRVSVEEYEMAYTQLAEATFTLRRHPTIAFLKINGKFE